MQRARRVQRSALYYYLAVRLIENIDSDEQRETR
jgi:hypothetical protein